MMDYKFFSNDQSGQSVNLNLLSGILPKERCITDIREAYDYEGGLIVIDSNMHKTHIEKELFSQRADNNRSTLLLVDYAYETGLSEDQYDNKVRQIAKQGVNIKNVIFVFNRSAYHSWMDKHSRNIVVIDLFATSAAIRHAIHNLPVSQTLVKDRPQRVNLLLGKPNKQSRLLITKSLFDRKSLIDPLVSLLGKPKDLSKYDDGFIKFIEDNQGPVDDVAVMDTNEGVSSQGWSSSTDVYDQTAVSIVCETHETNDSIFLTEKTYRPILNRHPFVIRSSFKALEYLRSVGFKTFNDFIDEDYNSDGTVSQDNADVLIQRAEELLKATQSNTDQIQEIVDHNYKVVIALAQLELARLNQKIFEALK